MLLAALAGWRWVYLAAGRGEPVDVVWTALQSLDGALFDVFLVAPESTLVLREVGRPLWQRVVVQALAVLVGWTRRSGSSRTSRSSQGSASRTAAAVTPAFLVPSPTYQGTAFQCIPYAR